MTALGAMAYTVGKFGWGSLIQLGALIAEFYTVITKGVPVMPSSAANRADSETTGPDRGS